MFEHDGVKHELQPGDVLFYNASYPHSVTAGETTSPSTYSSRGRSEGIETGMPDFEGGA